MNRYEIKPSASAQAASKEREFQKAWFKVAKLHQTISDIFLPNKVEGLALNVDSFHFSGNNMSFYERADSLENFHINLSFKVIDIQHRDNPSHDVSISIHTIFESTPEALKANILKQVQDSIQKYDLMHRDPDYERAFGSSPQQSPRVVGPLARRQWSAPPKKVTDDYSWLDD